MRRRKNAELMRDCGCVKRLDLEILEAYARRLAFLNAGHAAVSFTTPERDMEIRPTTSASSRASAFSESSATPTTTF